MPFGTIIKPDSRDKGSRMNNAALSNYGDDFDPKAVTQMIMRLFSHWGLTYEQQAALLSLSRNTNSSIARYKSGKSFIALDRDKFDRIGHLLAIHKCLRMIFPMNTKLAYEWPTTPNKYFNGRTPVQVVIDDGFLGLVEVRKYLEHYIAS